MQDRIFYAGCFGFALGVLVRSFVAVNIYFVIFFLALAFILFLLTYFTRLKWGIIISVFVFTVSFGVLRFHAAEVKPLRPYDTAIGMVISSEGMIVEDIDIRENSQKLVVEEELSGGKTKILITTNLAGYFQYGDIVKFSGKIEKPQNFVTDQGKEFDYVNYLRKDGIYYVMNYANVEIISHGHGNKVKSILFAIKDKFVQKINSAIQAPESTLMGGLILGEKSSFSDDLRQNFINTGTIHIVALSGYNVTIVAEWIMKLFKFLPQALGISAGIFAILLFVLMTGGSSTAIRAGIMATLALVARATGRGYDVARALVLAGVIMILLNPFVLVYDVSFQLSFIATVAVIFLAPRIERHFQWVTERFQLRDIISVTCAAYIFVLPFILYKMGNLSLVALPANILILPFIPFTMMLGFLTGLAGLIWHVLAVPVGFISYLFLHYELAVINFFARIPFSALTIPNFPLIITLLIYTYFIYRLFGRNIKNFFTESF